MSGTVILNEHTLNNFTEHETGFYLTSLYDAFVLVPGNTYKVVWDGEVYSCVAYKNETLLGTYAVFIGNEAAVTTGSAQIVEPFLIYFMPDNLYNVFFVLTPDPHTVSIYLVEGTILKNRDGEDIEYYGVETLTVDTTEGDQQTFTKGTILEDVRVDLDFSEGNMLYKLPEDYLARDLTVIQPENLVPENIKKGENIAGIDGTLEGAGAQLAAYIQGSLVNIESSEVTTVASKTFYYNPRIQRISFPKCTIIEDYAFYACTSLVEAYVPECTQLSSNAFYNCNKLQQIEIPKCTRLESAVFSNCYNLSSISAPNVSYIGSAAFSNCSKLTEVSFPKCTYIGHNAFYRCIGLESINAPLVSSIFSSAFAYTPITEAIFPSCTYLGTSAFYSCSKLSIVSMNKLSALPAYAFQSISTLVSVYLPSCSSLGTSPFSGCSKLQYLYVDNMPYMYSYVLSNACDNQVFTVQGNAYWYSSAFRYCKASKIIFEAGGSYYPYMFAYNTTLKDVYFVNQTPWVRAFTGCTALLRCSVSNWFATYVASSCFSGCTKLKAVKLQTCTHISTHAFYGCSALSVLYITNPTAPSTASVVANAFTNTPMSNSTYLGYFGSIYVSASLVDVYKALPGYSVFADRITAETDEIRALFEGDPE